MWTVAVSLLDDLSLYGSLAGGYPVKHEDMAHWKEELGKVRRTRRAGEHLDDGYPES
jgi:hypothetical protein